MATFTQRPNKKWQAKIRRQGFSQISKTFLTKSLAEAWARKIEVQLDKGTFESTSEAERVFMPDLIHKYWEEVVQFQKAANCTIYTLNKFILKFDGYRMIDMTTAVIKNYKDVRCKTVKGDTIRKELLLLKRFFNYAMKEWQIYLPKGNPVDPISIPKKGKSRDRRLEEGEYETLMKQAKSYQGVISQIIDFAIETGMRRSEILKLEWRHLLVNKQIIRISDTKNGDARVVPLSTKALAILIKQNKEGDKIFNISADAVTHAFIKVVRRAELEDLRFHDLRHEATSRLFEKGLNIMEVASITGHKDLAMLKRYTHLRPENLAKKLG